MYVWNGARNNQRNLSDSLYGRGETHSDDSGLSAGQYHPLWDVYVPGQSAGGGGYGGGSRGPDTPAVCLRAGRNMDTDQACRIDKQEALPYQ